MTDREPLELWGGAECTIVRLAAPAPSLGGLDTPAPEQAAFRAAKLKDTPAEGLLIAVESPAALDHLPEVGDSFLVLELAPALQPDQLERLAPRLPAGTVQVDIRQPLGRLAFYLIEPRSDDGLVDWNILDDALGEGVKVFPIVRTRH